MDTKTFDQVAIKSFKIQDIDGKVLEVEEVDGRSGARLRIIDSGETLASIQLSRDAFSALSDIRYRIDWENPEKAARVLSTAEETAQ